MSYRPCVVPQRSHWGPRGAAGILPVTVTADGRAWVLLSHRSPHVQAGDSWSCLGAAVDAGETPWQAAIRETGEEIRGISADPAGIAGEHIWDGPSGAAGPTRPRWCASRRIPAGACRASGWPLAPTPGRRASRPGCRPGRSRPAASFTRHSQTPGRRCASGSRPRSVRRHHQRTGEP